MKELDSTALECVIGGNKIVSTIAKKTIIKAGKEYAKDPDKVASRAKKNWGTKKKIDHYSKRTKKK